MTYTRIIFGHHVEFFVAHIGLGCLGPYLTRDDFGMRGVGFRALWWGVGACWWPKGAY